IKAEAGLKQMILAETAAYSYLSHDFPRMLSHGFPYGSRAYELRIPSTHEYRTIRSNNWQDRRWRRRCGTRARL
ncbi:MAG: hypothetical protein ACR2O2_06430, partial [Ruegeria sp.]